MPFQFFQLLTRKATLLQRTIIGQLTNIKYTANCIGSFVLGRQTTRFFFQNLMKMIFFCYLNHGYAMGRHTWQFEKIHEKVFEDRRLKVHQILKARGIWRRSVLSFRNHFFSEMGGALYSDDYKLNRVSISKACMALFYCNPNSFDAF